MLCNVRLHAEAHAYLKWNNEEKPMQKVALTSAPVRVRVVDQPIVAWGLERLIESAHPRLSVAGRADRVEDCVEQLRKNPADVALVDLDCEAGEEAVARLFALPPSPPPGTGDGQHPQARVAGQPGRRRPGRPTPKRNASPVSHPASARPSPHWPATPRRPAR